MNAARAAVRPQLAQASRFTASAFRFVGNEDGGDNVAALYTLVSKCEGHSVSPFDYLGDVMFRVSRVHARSQQAIERWEATRPAVPLGEDEA
jgi:hypothetical protein